MDPESVTQSEVSQKDKNKYCTLTCMVKNPPAMQDMQDTWVQSLGQEDPLEEGMATHSSTVAWRIPCTEKSDGLLSMRSVDSYMTEWQTHTHSA